MKKVLFINACIRGNDSRTLRLANCFLGEYKQNNPQDIIEELVLSDINIEPLTSKSLEERNIIIANNDMSHPNLRLACNMACADKLVIAAPFWELSFPAVLKIYIELVAVAGITFLYTEDGYKGLVKADKLMYITTRGGDFSGVLSHFEMGLPYITSVFSMFGVKEINSLSADGLDIIGNNPDKILEEKFYEAKILAQDF